MPILYLYVVAWCCYTYQCLSKDIMSSSGSILKEENEHSVPSQVSRNFPSTLTRGPIVLLLGLTRDPMSVLVIG